MMRPLIIVFLIAYPCASAFGTDVIIASEKSDLLKAVGPKLEAEYIYPDVAKRMADSIARVAREGHYASITDGHQLADKLRDDLRAVSHDEHLWVGYHPEGARDEPLSPSMDDLKSWKLGAAVDNFGFRRAEQLEGNVGYVRFDIFAYPYLAAERASEALGFVADTNALIIDLRENVGGSPEMVAYVASFFFDQRTHLNDLLFRQGNRLEQFWTDPENGGRRFGNDKPIYILTSHKTFSGAEDFTYAMQTLKRAKVVGETTGGGAHPSREFRVTEHFTVAIPYARSVSPVTGLDWEGVGITPDIAATATDAMRAAYKDALQTLVATSDGSKKEWLQGLLSKASQ